jgi:DNA ligase-4
MIFDLLYLNGQSLLDKSTAFRKRNMRHCVKETKGRIEYVTEFKGKTGRDVRDKMERVMEARGEGLVIKHPLSKYVLNGRNADWIKVKPEYMVRLGRALSAIARANPGCRITWARPWTFWSLVRHYLTKPLHIP